MDYYNNKLNDRIDDIIDFDPNYFNRMKFNENIEKKLLNYQILQVMNLVEALNNNDCILEGSDTGTGKTYTTCAAAKKLNMKLFVICPKIVMSKWHKISKYFDVENIIIVNYETLKFCKTYNSENKREVSKYINFIDGKYIWADKELPDRTLIVFDEVHKCKKTSTKNGKLLLSTKLLPTRYNKIKIIMLSATISDLPKDFTIFGYMLGLYKTIRRGNGWIEEVLREDNNSLKKNYSTLNKILFPTHGSRMSIKELGDNFPTNQVAAECYTIDNKDANIINNKLDELKKTNINELGEIQTARQLIEKAKVPLFISLINSLLENNLSVVVFVNFTETINLLSKAFNTKCIIWGNQTTSERELNIHNFQNNIEHLIICNIRAGGIGIDLNDKYGKQRASLISPPFSSNDLIQALGRISRADSKTPALQRIIYAHDTYEEIICDRIKEKLKFAAKINNEDLINL
jgi:superfamily II DNA or RNA helicase